MHYFKVSPVFSRLTETRETLPPPPRPIQVTSSEQEFNFRKQTNSGLFHLYHTGWQA